MTLSITLIVHDSWVRTAVEERDAQNRRIPLTVQQRMQDADGNDIPIMIPTTEELGLLWDVWHNLSKEDVLSSCRTFFQHGEDIDRQNLSWSHDMILKNVDSNLAHIIIAECESQPPHARSGPHAFCVAAGKVMAASSNLSHNVNSGLRELQLRHFQGEDVNECVFVLRNVLKILNYGVVNLDRSPPNLLQVLFDVFQQCSNGQFRAFMQNLRDFHHMRVNTPELLFSEAQACCRNVLASPTRQWLKTKKSKSAFIAGKSTRSAESEPSADQADSNHQGQGSSTASPPSSQGNSGRSRRQPVVVDRNPPAEGEPIFRTGEGGRTEHWCSKCPKGGRWGNHNADGHDAWYESFLEMKRKREERRQAEASNGNPSSGTTPNSASSSPSASSGASSNQVNDAPGSMRRGEAHASMVDKSDSSTASTTAKLSAMFRRQYVSFNDSDDDSF